MLILEAVWLIRRSGTVELKGYPSKEEAEKVAGKIRSLRPEADVKDIRYVPDYFMG